MVQNFFLQYKMTPIVRLFAVSIIVLITMAASKPVADDNKIYSVTSNFDDGNAIAGGDNVDYQGIPSSDGDDDNDDDSSDADGGDSNVDHGDGGDGVNNGDGDGNCCGSGDDDAKTAIIAMAGIFIGGK